MEKVLIIDDNKELCSLLAEMFAKSGIETVSAGSGDEALETIRGQTDQRNSLTICILDVIMPGLHGVRLMKAIREIIPEVRFMLITAFYGAQEADEMIMEGTVEIFYKPFRIEDLIAKVNFILSNTQRIPVQ